MDAQFAGVRLLVMDFRRSFHSYHDVLGLPVHWGDEESGYASFATDGSLIAIFGRQDMAEIEPLRQVLGM